jgi:hypothetical protein
VDDEPLGRLESLLLAPQTLFEALSKKEWKEAFLGLKGAEPPS